MSTAVRLWLGFAYVAIRAPEPLSCVSELAGDAYTYLHPRIVAGVIMVAMADDLLITRPAATLSPTAIATTLGGPPCTSPARPCSESA